MPNHSLKFKAGPAAMQRIKAHGFSPELIGSILGASGGAKWLAISQIDRVVASEILPKLNDRVYLLGSSIGAWRMACYAQKDPLAAIERFERLYLDQEYSSAPDAAEISRVAKQIVDELIGDTGADDALTHPTMRLNVMTVRARHLAASDRRAVLMPILLAAMAANAVSRKSLGATFTRGLFFDPRDLPPFHDVTGFPIEQTPLSPENLMPAIQASGSIPMVMHGVQNIPGAPPGMYRDGGVIDYHLDLPTVEADRIALYVHFFDWLKPGWFDRRLNWRKLDAASTDDTLLICPSPEFIQKLPNAKVPDRTDFVNFSPDERRRIWRQAIAQCEALGAELHEVLHREALPGRLEPI